MTLGIDNDNQYILSDISYEELVMLYHFSNMSNKTFKDYFTAIKDWNSLDAFSDYTPEFKGVTDEMSGAAMLLDDYVPRDKMWSELRDEFRQSWTDDRQSKSVDVDVDEAPIVSPGDELFQDAMQKRHNPAPESSTTRCITTIMSDPELAKIWDDVSKEGYTDAITKEIEKISKISSGQWTTYLKGTGISQQDIIDALSNMPYGTKSKSTKKNKKK